MIFLTLITVVILVFLSFVWVQISKLKSKVSELEQLVLSQPGALNSDSADDQNEEELIETDEIKYQTPATKNPWENPVSLGPTISRKRTGAVREKRNLKNKYSYVFSKKNFSDAGNWLKKNWFLVVAAISLALSGVFLVQYGVENGFLSPFWRVIAAAVLGILLIWLGEYVRRRWGDGSSEHSAYLPSTFSGAGLVALFSAVLAARQLYGLIGPEGAMIWLVGISVVAVILGWFYGPFLAVVGLIGSLAAPFLVGGENDSTTFLYYYFAMIVVAGLLVDALKRWAWISSFTLIFSFLAAWVVFQSGIGELHFLVFALVTTFAAVVIPPLNLTPTHKGEMISNLIVWTRGTSEGSIDFSTRIAGGTFVAAAIVGLAVANNESGTIEVWLALGTLGLLALLGVIWFRKAPALTDLPIVPLVFILLVIVLQSFDYGSLYSEFRAGASRPPETSPPRTVSILSAVGLIASILAFLRGAEAGKLQFIWSAGAALIAPTVLIALEIWWEPAFVLGAGNWALHVIAVGAVMVLFVERSARADHGDLRRASIFLLAALSLISFAMVIILNSTALTLSLAVMILVAAMIDRRFKMPLLMVFIQIASVIISGRLVIYPGIFWAVDASLWEVGFAYVGVITLMLAAWSMQVGQIRERTQVILESAIWMLVGVLISVLLFKWLNESSRLGSHWGVSLMALVWSMSMANQIYRFKLGGFLKWLRIGLAVLFGIIAAVFYVLLFTIVNPLLAGSELVVGPPVVDSLFVAFLLPAGLFGFVAWRFEHLKNWMRFSFGVLSSVFAIYYVGLEIRRAWQGNNLHANGVLAGELYSYTVAILLVSVATLFIAFNQRSIVFRRVAMTGIGLTIAKVFLIDMSGLDGLYRVASFLGLGLSLAGLAWLYRQMLEQWSVPKSQQ